MKVLFTGFEPFGGENTNPSAVAVEQICQLPPPNGVQWQALILPVEFSRSAALLQSCINSWQPDLVLCIGQAGGRPQISLEQVAINLLEARIPDNSGWQPSGEPIVATGPAAYFSTLPLKAIRQQLQQSGIPANISYTAGTYVCNALMYQLLHHQSFKAGGRGGFIHIPYTPEQAAGKADAASMAVATVVTALTEIVRCCQQYSQDIAAVGGTLD